jgi:hypothetical protein
MATPRILWVAAVLGVTQYSKLQNCSNLEMGNGIGYHGGLAGVVV